MHQTLADQIHRVVAVAVPRDEVRNSCADTGYIAPQQVIVVVREPKLTTAAC